MATRLYPNTKNTEVICRLLGLPLDTAEKHAALAAEFQARKDAINSKPFDTLTEDERRERFWANNDISEAEYNAMRDQPHLGEYDSFLTFGWGRVGPLCEDYSGRECDPVKVAAILREKGINLNGVRIFDLEGVHWC